MNSKRYDQTVDVTIRIPNTFRNKLRDLVQKIEDKRIEVPGTDQKVKPSISVLALRGLEMEFDGWTERIALEAEEDKIREARAAIALEKVFELRDEDAREQFFQKPGGGGKVHLARAGAEITLCCSRAAEGLKRIEGPVEESSLCKFAIWTGRESSFILEAGR